MTQSGDEATHPTPFVHSLRTDWGIAVLSGESQGKRRYLFESGVERTLASGFYELMHEVERPDDQQRLTCERLGAELETRGQGKSAPERKGKGPTFEEQYQLFLRSFPEGLLDPKWVSEVRREREVTLQAAQATLSAKDLDHLVGAGLFEDAWARARAIVNETVVVPVEARIPTHALTQPPRALATALRELLHGTARYEQRFDRYVAAFGAAYGQDASWQATTALSAFVHPTRHVCVDPTSFRKQLKTLSGRSSFASRPNGADYARLLGVAQVVNNKLTAQGEDPRDLLDVHGFIRSTLKAPAAKRRKAAPAPAADKKLLAL